LFVSKKSSNFGLWKRMFSPKLTIKNKNVMEKRKTPKADLESKRGLFLQIGLVFTLAVVLVAFEWRTYDRDLGIEINRDVLEDDEMIIQTEHPPPPPPPPPPQEIITELIIVDDDVEVEELIIDVEVDEREFIAEWVAPTIEIEEEVESDEVFVIVEDLPGFPGGIEAMHRFLQQNIRFPAIAREAGIQGTVFVTFVVERDGSITNVRVLRGIGGGCDEEAVRVVSMMPRWEPGRQRGRPVRVQFNMPIRFTLSG